MEPPPRPDRRDLAAAGTAALTLAMAYVIVAHPVYEFAAWLVVFCVWMLWFVSYGVRWVYGEG